MINIISSILLAVLLSGCAVKTEIILGNGERIVVHSKSDALVEVKDKDRTVIVNNQGKPTLLEQILTLMFMKVDVAEPILADE